MPFLKSYNYELFGQYSGPEEVTGKFYKLTQPNKSVVFYPASIIEEVSGKFHKFTKDNKDVYVPASESSHLGGKRKSIKRAAKNNRRYSRRN